MAAMSHILPHSLSAGRREAGKGKGKLPIADMTEI